MKKKLLSVLLVSAMVASMAAGCGNEAAAPAGTAAAGGDKVEATGSVYYLNFKPEANDAWQEIAASYTAQTGVPVTVVTAASNTYEKTLASEITKEEAPTLFQVNGPVGLADWKDYCYDLSGSDVSAQLTSTDYALMDGDKIAGIGFVIESYGLITNKKLLDKAGYSVDDIKSFADLKAVAEDITARKDELGFAAFTSAGMDASSDWRFKTHLANLPIYFEYKEDGIGATDAIKGSYLDAYKNIFDLYINNSTCDPKELAGKTGSDSETEFTSEQAVFFQNGTWEYSAVSAVLDPNDVTMIPIYCGVGDEANQGLCTGTENYWCVNAEADEADIQATLDFMNWMVTSEEGTKMMAEQFGVIPFQKAVESDNVFVKQDQANTAAGKTAVSWNFTTMPSENWKNDLGSALTAYAAGTGDWDAVVTAFVDGWASEYAAANAQ